MSVHKELSETICALELVSQVPAVNLDPTSRDSSESIGGKRPSGGIDRQDDRERAWDMKSADHFKTRIRNAHSERTLLQILIEAKQSLENARRMPGWKKGAVEPDKGTLRWKRMIADSYEPAHVLAKRHEISLRTIQNYRLEYGERPAA